MSAHVLDVNISIHECSASHATLFPPMLAGKDDTHNKSGKHEVGYMGPDSLINVMAKCSLMFNENDNGHLSDLQSINISVIVAPLMQL